MDDKYINRNAFFKELIRQGGSWTYAKVKGAFEGEPGSLSAKERMQILKLFREQVSIIEDNIKKS